jgi:HPt (histidine-containing phosphotransfer) domain-containing protein
VIASKLDSTLWPLNCTFDFRDSDCIAALGGSYLRDAVHFGFCGARFRMSDDIVREFLVESSENLDLLDRELINLEKDPGNRGTLASIFRTIHTIKGTCGFLGFTKLESVAHVGENLLSTVCCWRSARSERSTWQTARTPRASAIWDRPRDSTRTATKSGKFWTSIRKRSRALRKHCKATCAN